MTDRMLQLWIEFAERLLMADRYEHRVVAEAAVSAGRPDEGAVDAPFERFGLAVVRPGDRERAEEVGRWCRVRLGRLCLAPDLFHRAHPVAVAVLVFRPSRGEDSRPPGQRLDAEAAVVGERRQAAEIGSFARLEVGVVGEGHADLVRLRQSELLGADAGYA